MTAKHLHFHDDARERILRGADQLARAVRVTLGPRGRTVILEREFGGPQIVNSGVLVARAVELEDPAENLGAQLLREVAARTSEQAGDGTTTATVLAHAMLQEGQRYLAAGLNPVQIKRGIEQGVEAVVSELRRLAQPCTGSTEIAHVAAISANNDRSIGDLLARAIDRVGRDGAITIEDGSGLASELNVVEGLQFDRGFLSPYFITDTERQACVLEDAAILLFDQRLSSVKDLLPLLEEVVKAGRPLLVVAEDADSEALATLVINTLRGTLKTCAVKAPGFGDRRRALLQDMAVLTGGTLLSEEVGLPLAKATLAHLGHARRVEVTRDATTLVGGGGTPTAIASRVAQLRKEREAATAEVDRTTLDERIAKLSGGVAVIKVGAATDTELKERRIRIDDALHATRAAVEEGIVPGGGLALLRARRVLRGMKGATLDEDSGLRIVHRALEEPLRRIVANAGQEPSMVLDRVELGPQADMPVDLQAGARPGAGSHAIQEVKPDPRPDAGSAHCVDRSDSAWGYNAATGAYGDLLQVGVIDPAKVTRLALQNAGSIAGLILMTDCVIVRPAARMAASEAATSGLEPEPGDEF